MLSWISDSLAESEPAPKDMTAVNAGVHELAGVRLPLQPYSGGHAVFMYSTASDGNVTLQLKEPDDLDKNSLAAMLARLHDDATFSISYQDTDILSDGSIDVLLGTGTANSGGSDAVAATFDLFDSSSGPDLTLSPQTFTNSAEAFINDNSSNSLGGPVSQDNDAVSTTSTEDKKPCSTSSDPVKLAVKRPRPKAASPNRQGPQQCQVCAKVFGNASALAKHKLTHSDERKYVCSMCGKAFKRQDHLNGHMLTHRNKKPYECKAEGCGKSYCDARSLRRHTENHHSSAGGGGTVSASTTMSPAQGAASGDAASPHGSSCIQYAPPPTSTSAASPGTSGGKSQLQQLLAIDPAKGGSGGNNDGLTKQQLDLIHQIMEQTQRQSQQQTTATNSKTSTVTTPKSSTPSKVTATKTPVKMQRAQSSSNKNSSSTSGQQSKVSTTTPNSSNTPKTAEPKPVECNLCHRKFKNIPALNGHMRLHGGYFKKDADNKKCEKKDTNTPPLQTASVSVRALIEEKIINKRITQPQPTTPTEEPKSTAPPLFPLTVHSSATSSDLDTKITSFVVPAPPQQTAEKTRRHSDAEAFNHRISNTQQEAQALADLILKREIKREKASVKRTTSDPGQTNLIQFQSNDSLSLTFKQEEIEYLSPSLQDEVFTQVQDTMLLQGVDPNQLATLQFQTEDLLPDQTDQNLQNLNLDDYANLQDQVGQSPSYQSSHNVNQDLQAVLDSPLPESLAEFSTFHSNNLDLSSPSYQNQSPAQYVNSPHTSIAQSPLQSPLIRQDSPGFPYPTPPASHEGQSPCFSQNTLLPLVSPKQEFGAVVERGIDEPPQASSPLSAAFFTSTMSSSAAVEEALEEVLPGETISNDDLYPLSNSPSPQSPIGLTPVQSPLPNIATTAVSSPHPTTTFSASNTATFNISPQYTLQSQMMPNSEDPLLSSSSVNRKRCGLSGIPLRVMTNNGLLDLNTANFAGILLDANGEIKFIQTGANTFQSKNIVLANTQMVQTPQDDDKTKLHRMLKTVQCALPTKQFIAKPKQVVEIKKEENNDVFLSPTSIPSSPVRTSRKRLRTEPLQLPVFHQSKLRATRSKPAGSSAFTPQPILNPQRQGTGLFNNLKTKSSDDTSIWNCEPIPETDSTPHINVGPQFQCNIPPVSSRLNPVSKHEDLLWDPGINNCSDAEVDMYLDFACCAAVPGGGRNKEYAMHLLHMCSGNIHEAMLKLMQPSPNLPADHPLLCYQYSESDKWSSTETEIFHKALIKYDKDFHSISKEVKSKSVKQCIQFYYVWKKVCTDEYRKLKQVREKRNHKNSESDMDEKPYPDAKLLGIADSGSPMPVQDATRNFVCEFPECSASFNSRAALNGHIRIHGGTAARNSPTPAAIERRSASVSSTVCHPDSTEDYPCKICGKVFSKIKSRSAHMKSHRPPDAETSKRRESKDPQNYCYELSVPSPYSKGQSKTIESDQKIEIKQKDIIYD
ncbi:uncharacterized protein LOC109598471 isoform X2 [Aethina tumida]|uniref:uncharacterized protein LOC109598471 isoform X2 n=1 Tax=Aethina tumida TaxID=116153 RepID=UPI0021477603|nr:uncharacterized protein LOC109598471 isoform X2 [Aethina tumida]